MARRKVYVCSLFSLLFIICSFILRKQTAGVLKIGQSGISWKTTTGNAVSVASNELDTAEWMHLGPTCQLRVASRKGSALRFAGLRQSDQTAIRNALQSLGVQLETQTLSTKGLNFGRVRVRDAALRFAVDGGVSFEVPLSDISQAQAAKSEVSIEFRQDDTSAGAACSLLEMRLYVPTDTASDQSAEALHKQLISTTEMAAAGSVMVALKQLHVLTPRSVCHSTITSLRHSLTVSLVVATTLRCLAVS